jgi:hypothetical protein
VSLSELMSAMDLSVYPQVAMVIFLAVFASVTWRVFTKRAAEDCREAALLPLEDEVRRGPGPGGRAGRG